MRAPSSRRVVAVPLLAAVALLGGVAACKTQATPAAEQEVALTTVVIPVEGMSCVACAARVRKTLAGLDGVGHVEVSLRERRARVRFDSHRVSPEQLVATINGLGYHAGAPVEPNP